MLERLLSRQPVVGVEHEAAADEVHAVIRDGSLGTELRKQAAEVHVHVDLAFRLEHCAVPDGADVSEEL